MCFPAWLVVDELPSKQTWKTKVLDHALPPNCASKAPRCGAPASRNGRPLHVAVVDVLPSDVLSELTMVLPYKAYTSSRAQNALSERCTDPCAHQSPMLAAQVNARKHDQLRMILGFVWIWGLSFCKALLGWLLTAAAVAGRAFGLF